MLVSVVLVALELELVAEAVAEAVMVVQLTAVVAVSLELAEGVVCFFLCHDLHHLRCKIAVLRTF